MTTAEQKIESLTILAFNDGGEGLIPTRGSKGEIRFADSVDFLWEDCDFDGLEGFVVFEGSKHYKPDDYDPDKSDLNFQEGWDWLAIGEWRRATTHDLVEAGLCELERGANTVVPTKIALTDRVIDHIVTQYNLKYEELSDDPFEDSEGGMSMSEKHQRSCSAARKTVSHYVRTGQLRHYHDVEAFEASLPARPEEAPVPAEAAS